MNLIKNCITKLQESDRPIKIAFVEGQSKRVVAAALQLKEQKIIEPVLIFETNEAFKKQSAQLEGIETFVIEKEKETIEKFAKDYEALRNGKETYEKALADMQTAQFVAAMLIRNKMVDGALGGVHLATSEILKAAFKAIGPKEGIKTISSVMLMAKGEDAYLFGDISVNPAPTSEQLSDIAQNANDFAKAFDIEEKIAFLSFSTSGSAVNAQTKLVKDAVEIFNDKSCSKYPAIGEIQFDAAFVDSVKKQKYKYDHNFDGTAKIFIFPDLNSGNIGYKIAQRMGGLSAMGPVITGLKQPYNDLSRGSTVENIVDSAIVTATQALAQKKGKNNE